MEGCMTDPLQKLPKDLTNCSSLFNLQMQCYDPLSQDLENVLNKGIST